MQAVFFFGQTPFDGLAAHALGVDAFAVIDHADDDAAALLLGLNADDRLFGLARLAALFGFFHTMVCAVAHHVEQGVGQ